ncbi:elongin A, like [Electrophorus electricus]|uniref:elongin A, like n=1 Tax=Electrophorus electricus TaxID=8005 RepID=UPI0015D0BDA4|nr:elongin A, like [Electrophorus electricus]
MASADVEKVLQLKLQLKESREGRTLLKTLKKLQELDITLDILAETGIGKVVNSFRKHDDAGEMAKMLVHRWKKLVPKEPSSSNVVQLQSPSMKEEVQQTGKEENSEASGSTKTSEAKHKNENIGLECKPSKNIDSKSKFKQTVIKSKDCTDGEKKDCTKKDSDVGHKPQTPKKSSKEMLASGYHKEKKDCEQKNIAKDSDVMNTQLPKNSNKQKNSHLKEDDLCERQREKKRDALKKRDHEEKKRTEKVLEVGRDPEIEEFEMPSMSFEAYLNYDREAPKRKKRACDRNLKHLKTNQKEDGKVREVSNTTPSDSAMESSITLGSKGSVLDLLKVPLPVISPESEDLSQYQYLTEKKVQKATDTYEEAAVFTGQRLNKKMQVYSGSKAAYLPTMMTLYQQCIRTLQNNIDSLYEIGGVPFELLEPVLERCRPEQLLRIEDCNPVYIGVTDHLWERHCRRDFRNAQLEEYEAWREMYLRLSEEREHKLQQLTRSIVSAHSGKPKGRQVKMAFIHSAAKPPRNVRMQQELHGTASPGFPHPADKASGKSQEGRGRPCFSEPSKPPSTSSGNNQSQDPRKIKRVAPMMAKSLKAFKKQLGRR